MKTPWRYYQHPVTRCRTRVHKNDRGKAMIYERWGWDEIRMTGS